MELKKNPNRNVIRFSNPEFAKREVLETPTIQTLNTLRGKSGEGYKQDSYWLRIPDKLMQNMGVRVRYAKEDLRVIFVRK